MKNVIYGVVALALGGFTIYMALQVSAELKTKRAWPTVPGAILERKVGESMGKGRNYIPVVVYRYTVAGTTYTHDQVYMIRRTGLLADKARELVDGFPDPVPVRYNPQDPQDAFLILNPSGTKWLMAVAGGVIALVGLMLLLVGLTKKGT